MKKSVLVIMILLCVSVVSAGYECSGTITENQKEMTTYDVKSINGVGVGLIYSDETAATLTSSVQIIVDAVEFTVSNSTNSTGAEMAEKNETILLEAASGDTCTLKIGSDSEEFSLEDEETADSLSVIVTSIDDVFPNGNATVEGIIGKEKVSLDNTNDESLVKISGTDYVFEMFTASDTNAIIKVKTCDGNFTFVNDTEIETNITNTTISNESTETNVTNESEEVNSTLLNGSEAGAESSESTGESKTLSTVIYIVIIVLIVVLVAVFAIILFRKKRLNNPAVHQNPPGNSTNSQSNSATGANPVS